MGVSGGIRGAQVKDDSLTGDDIAENTLVMPQAYHSSGNHDSINAIEYLALPGRNGWTTTFLKREMQLIAPYDGSVTKVFLRPTTGDDINASEFQVRTNGNGYEAKNGATNVVTTINTITLGISEGTTETVLSTPAVIPKGHAFSFGILKSAGSGYGITDAVIVIEWDLSA